MAETQKEKQPWERQKNEPNASYALFNEFLLIGPLRTLPKLIARVTDNDQFDPTPSLTNLKNKSAQWKWFERAESYDAFHIEEKRSKIEARTIERLITRLEKSEEIEDKINEKMIEILSMEEIKPSKMAYAVSELSKAKKNEIESQRLDLGEPTIIQKTDSKVEGKVQVNDPVADVKALEETLKKNVRSKDLDEVVEQFTCQKTGTSNENTKKSDISDL